MTASATIQTSLSQVLHSLLVAGSVKTQEDIQRELLTRGIETNQSKISRMLRKLGAIKVTNLYGETIYRLPHDYAPPKTGTALTELVTNITHNESMVVLHTSPGSASLIARLLDHHRDDLNILGSVAGDDTIFIVPQSVHDITQLCETVKSVLATANF